MYAHAILKAMNQVVPLRIFITLSVGVAILVFAMGALRAQAFEWGGQFTSVVPCWNAAIFTSVSGPRGGPFIWAPVTRTFSYGPPSHAGQYGLGLAGPPYMCVVSPYPVIVLPGIMMLMVGTSQ